MASGASNPVRYFGRQVRKARLAAGWTLAEFGQRTGYDPAHLSRIENGKRPATKLIAADVRPGISRARRVVRRVLRGVPHLDRDPAVVPQLGRAASSAPRPCGTGTSAVVDGLLQTEDYARAILGVTPGVTDDEVSARVAARMKRQAILTRDDPPAAWFLVDEAALRRCVGSPEIMAAQTSAARGASRACRTSRSRSCPRSRMPACSAGSRLPSSAAYVETAVAGQVFEDAEIIASLLTRFDTLRNEALRASESLAFIERMCEEWKATGARAATQADNGGACVEVASAEAVLVRDTTDRSGPVAHVHR